MSSGSDGVMTQQEFADLVGISQQAVSDFVQAGVLVRGDSWQSWLRAYVFRLREQAAGRLSETGGVDLVHERALLAREQRLGHEIKNAISRQTYAPIELLADVLANASQAIVDRLEQVPAALKRQCPDLPPEAFDVLTNALASARNEWVRKTESFVMERLEAEAEAAAIDDDELATSSRMCEA